MKAITIRLTEEELEKLQRIKAAGFSSISEIVKCAALSLVDSAPKTQQPA